MASNNDDDEQETGFTGRKLHKKSISVKRVEDEDTGLAGATAQAERNKPKIRLPRVADDPMLERTIATLRKYYGPQIESANIQPMPWHESSVEPNIYGTTSPDQDVMINRRLLATGSPLQNLSALAHELTHVGQFQDPLQKELMMKYEGLIPYRLRPSEVESFNTSDQLVKMLRRRMYESGQLHPWDDPTGSRPSKEEVDQYGFGPYGQSQYARGFPNFLR